MRLNMIKRQSSETRAFFRQRLNTPQIIWTERPCIGRNVDHRSGRPLSKAWWWSRFSHLVLFFGGGIEGYKNYFQGTSARFLIPLSKPPTTITTPTEPAGWMCLCRESVYGGWGTRVFNNAAFRCSSSAPTLLSTETKRRVYVCVSEPPRSINTDGRFLIRPPAGLCLFKFWIETWQSRWTVVL